MAFFFDPSKGETPQSIALKRELAARLLGRGGRAPAENAGQGWGNALASIGDGITANVLNRRANKAESEGQAGANDLFDQIRSSIVGGNQFPSAPGANATPLDNATQRVAQAHETSAEPGQFSGSQQEFVDMLMPAALEASERTGIDPRIIVAQAAQETGWGRSAPGNNFFGIKSHGKGGGQNLKTHEFVNGKRVNVTDSFRQFGSPEESVAGYADFIAQNPRYKPLMEAQGLDAQLEALGASGYATDPNYARSVGAIARSIQVPEPQPAQVASLDPSIGMPSATPPLPPEFSDMGLSPEAWERMNAPDGVSPGPGNVAVAGGRGDRVSVATPRSASPDQQFQVGAPAASTSAGQRVLSTMMAPQSMTGGAPMPMQGMAPQAAPQPAQVAQARNHMSGNADVPVSGGLDLQLLMQAASNPFLNEGQRSVVNALLQQQLKAMDPNASLDAEYRRAQIENMQSQIRERENPNARDKFGNSVIWGQDADGKWVAMQPSSGGGLVPAETPDGVNLVPPGVSNLDLGNQFGIRDRAGNIIGTVDKNLAQAEADKTLGKSQGEAQFDLPRVEQNAAQTLNILERMKTHPGRAGSTGFIQGALPSRTSDQVDFQSLVDQTQGQSFLQAFQTLKGGGQITEIEGQKATDAISRLRNQRLSDQDYLRAITDLEEVINNGLERARKQAGISGGRAPEAPRRLRFNPATGELE